MSMNQGEKRRRRTDKVTPVPYRHALAVHIVHSDPPSLEARCVCGVVVSGKRFSDREMISLSDMLILVRLHSGNEISDLDAF